MRIYISGPMTGLPDHNYPAFNAAEAQWEARGWTVRNPARNFGGDENRKREEYMRLDFEHLLEVDAIALLPGWQDSRGARAEIVVALELGLDVFDAITALPLEVLADIDVSSAYPSWGDLA